MAITLRHIIVTSIPGLAAIFAFLWFTRKKTPDGIEDKKPKEEHVVLAKESVAVKKKDEPILSARNIVSEQISLGTPAMLNSASLSGAHRSKSPEKPPDEQKAKPAPQRDLKLEKRDTVNKDDSIPFAARAPLATSTPITSHTSTSQQQQRPVAAAVVEKSLNNNKTTVPASAKPEAVAIVEERIEAEVQSTVSAKLPDADQEIGQGDRSRSSDGQSDILPSQKDIVFKDSQVKSIEISSISSLQSSSRESKPREESASMNARSDSATEKYRNDSIASSGDSEEEAEEVTVSESDSGSSGPSSDNSQIERVDEVDGSEQVSRAQDSDSLPVELAVDNEVSAMNNGMITDEPTMSEASSVGSPAATPTNGVNGSHSDAQSEHSADSGTGSIGFAATPLQETAAAAADPDAKVEYAFDFPADMCGMLIGRRGAHIKDLKERSGAEISVKDKLYTSQFKLIVLEGTQKSIDMALDIVKKRFPQHKFGPIDFSPAQPENPVLVPEIMQLSLPDGVCADVNVSSVVAANHLFLQQPTHPSFYMLEKQNACMLMCYAPHDGIVPQLPRPIEVGMICAAPMYNGWYRAQVVAVHEVADEVDIKYVDYGGYAKAQSCHLRQIRSDFTTLPFQAVECYLANVIPLKDATVFPAEASAILEEMVHHQLLQAEVVAYEEDGVPYLNIYQTLPDQSMRLINRELVNRGVARWMEQPL